MNDRESSVDWQENSRQENSRMEAGAGFALAVLAAGLGLLAILERVGMPDRLLRLFVPAFMLAGFLVTATLWRTTRAAYFYAGGGAFAPRYCGLAAATLSAAMFFCLLPVMGTDMQLTILVLGFGLGLTFAFFGTGVLLRRSACLSIADLIAKRFPSFTRSLIVALAAATCAFLVGLAGYDVALHGFMAAMGLGRGIGTGVIGAVLCFVVIAGGLSTVLWIAVETMIIVVFGLVLPFVLDLIHARPLTLPIGDPTFLGKAQSALAAAMGAEQADHVGAISLIVVIALGLAALSPLLGPSIAGSRERGFARTGIAAFAWLALIGLLASMTMAASTLALNTTIVGQAPAKIPAEILTANAQGAITLCQGVAATAAGLAKDCAASQGYAGRLRAGDIRALPEFLLAGLAKLRHLGPMLSSLADSGLMALGLALAGAGFQSFVTNIGHDVIGPDRRRRISTSLRLALTRALAILSIAVAGLLLMFKVANTGIAMISALFISAIFFAPGLALLLWPLANSFDAAVTLATTLILTLVLAKDHSMMPIDLAPVILAACIGGLLAGLISSLLRSRLRRARAAEI